jgi:threonine synthase
MKYYSTNKKVSGVSLQDAVVKGLAEDKGLFMPDTVKMLPQSFYDNIENLSFQEIAYTVADAFFGDDVEAEALKEIVYDTLNFDVPLVHVADNIYSLELYHGPTLAFKDVGGRFMSRLLGYFIQKQSKTKVNVLVATSGDTGSAVANGFLGVDPCICALSERTGKPNSGMPVYYTRTEYHSTGSGWYFRRLPGFGKIGFYGRRAEC